jgi:hypothetical protein
MLCQRLPTRKADVGAVALRALCLIGGRGEACAGEGSLRAAGTGHCRGTPLS